MNDEYIWVERQRLERIERFIAGLAAADSSMRLIPSGGSMRFRAEIPDTSGPVTAMINDDGDIVITVQTEVVTSPFGSVPGATQYSVEHLQTFTIAPATSSVTISLGWARSVATLVGGALAHDARWTVVGGSATAVNAYTESKSWTGSSSVGFGNFAQVVLSDGVVKVYHYYGENNSITANEERQPRSIVLPPFDLGQMVILESTMVMGVWSQDYSVLGPVFTPPNLSIGANSVSVSYMSYNQTVSVTVAADGHVSAVSGWARDNMSGVIGSRYLKDGDGLTRTLYGLNLR